MKRNALGLSAVLAIGLAASPDAHALDPGCFAGPVFLEGIADGYCPSSLQERERMEVLPVVDGLRAPVTITMGDPKATVSTCKEWDNNFRRGLKPSASEDTSRVIYFERTCDAMNVVFWATDNTPLVYGRGTTRYLKTDGTNFHDLRLIDAGFLRNSVLKSDVPPGSTLGDLRDTDSLELTATGPGTLHFTWRGASCSLTELAVLDTNVDGIDDLAAAFSCATASGPSYDFVVFDQAEAGGRLMQTYLE